MNQAVTDYIDALGEKKGQEWQQPVCEHLRLITLEALPDAEERLQYGKPHYLIGGKYVAVFGTAKAWVSYTIFNAAELDPPAGFFEDGPPERRTLKIREGDSVDYTQLQLMLTEAAATVAP